MDSYQDLAVNTLHVLDDSKADDCRNGSVVINGGINVVKNVKACEVDASLIQGVKGKISDCMSVQHNIYTDGAILPLSTVGSAQLGVPTCKWKSIDVVSTNSQELCSVNAILRNSFLNNIYYNSVISNIEDTASTTATYEIYLDTVMNIINLNSTYDLHRMVIIRIPCAPTGTNHDYKRIIFKQNKCIPIKWSYNTDEYIIIEDKEQALDFININNSWRLINYNSASSKAIQNNAQDISSMQVKQSYTDISLACLQSDLQALIDYNSFLSATDTSANSLLDFIDENDAIKKDVTSIKTSINTMTTTIGSLSSNINAISSELTTYKASNNSKLYDVSLGLAVANNTIDLFKTVSNQTFQNINSQFLMYDTRISGMSLKMSSLELDVKKNQEFVDILDKRLCDHIANSDNKYKFLNDKMTHMNEKINLIMTRLNMC